MNYKQLTVLIGLVIIAAGAVYLLNSYINPSNIVSDQTPPPYQMPVRPQPKETTLFFGGDIMLSRNVGTKIFEAQNPTLPFEKIIDTIKNASLSFANLESPFNNKGGRVTQGLVFKAEPDTVTGLVNAGFDVLSTANNHSFDQGKAGIEYTMSLLKENSISPAGTGLDCHEGIIKEANGIKFGYLAYSYTAYNDGGKSVDPLVCNWNDNEQIAKDIAALKTQVDFVILSAHMGVEYQRQPTDADAAKARATIDAGADMFIGHHPHWMQTIEQYQGKYIFYSLGNFVFDQMWSQDTMEGLTVQVLFKDKNLSRITLQPVVIENYCCPRWATETETKTILSKINSAYSSPILIENGKLRDDWVTALQPKTSAD